MRDGCVRGNDMEHISQSDLERIEAFANTPAYKREPEQLLPGSDGTDA